MAEERKSAPTGSKETICIVLTLVALALVFTSALALVITLHSKDVELKRGKAKSNKYNLISQLFAVFRVVLTLI